MKTPRHQWCWACGPAVGTALIVLLSPLSLPAQVTNYYVDEGVGNNSYDGLSDVVSGSDGPKLNVSAAISVASGGSTIQVDAGDYAESVWDSGTNSVTLNPQGTVNVCGADLCAADTVGDGIPDWWRLEYFGTPTTTNAASCASCDPENDGFTNLEKFQGGLNPSVAYALTIPAQVNSHSTGNPASVTDLGNGATYTWSIDNGSITDGDGTPAVTWTAGDTGTTTLNVLMQAPGFSSMSASGSVSVTPCSLLGIILTPPEVRFGSTNTASVPNPFITVGVYNNGFIEGITQGSDSNFYGVSSDAADNRVFQITPGGAFTTRTLFYFSGLSTSNGYSAGWSQIYGTGPTNSQSGWPPVKGSGNDTSLYGVNPEGGLGTNLSGCIANSDASGYGTVYKLTAQGTLSILHTFTSGTLDGAYPLGGLVQGTGSDSSNFYGVTLYGGSTNCTMPWGCCIPGYGTIFKVSTNGHYYTLLHSFNGGSDGAYPNGLFMGSDGFLYGANTYGGTNSSRVAFPGTNGLGTVFKISTNSNGGPITILHQFAPGQGIWPDAPMVQIGSNVYGTTALGGTSNAGTVFQVDTNGDSGSFKTLYSFSGFPESSSPNGALVQAYDGNLYGTTPFGGSSRNGTIFRLSPSGVLTNFTNLYEFTGTADGNWPNWGGYMPAFSVSTFDGYLYGATIGTLFKYIPATYGWSIVNGTIIGPTDSPSIRWTPTVTNGVVTIYLTESDSTVCTQHISTTVIAYAGGIAAGGLSSVALKPDGTLWAWGNNDGDLGDGLDSAILREDGGGDYVELYLPYPSDVADAASCGVQTITNAVAVAAGGDDYTVVLDATGTVWTFGENDAGQLGNESEVVGDASTNLYHTPFPVSSVRGFTNVVSVAAGYQHTLVLCANGTVWAWGSDDRGALGAGYNAGSNNFAIQSQLPPGTTITAIAAGNGFSLAVDTTGQVWGWGDDVKGEIGFGASIAGSNNVPTPVTNVYYGVGVSNVIAIAAGASASGDCASVTPGGHSIALDVNRWVWTWGDNQFGQLGRTTTEAYDPTPTVVTALTNQYVVGIAGGVGFTLAVTSNGQVYAWGDNSFGELGTYTSAVPCNSVPMRVAGITNAVLVSAPRSDDSICNAPGAPFDGFTAKYPTNFGTLYYMGGVHAVAMTVDGGTNHYWAWGDNSYGQIGNGLSGGATNQVSQDTPAGPLQFCTRCQREVQLGTNGTFTAHCSGTLYLYFNTDNFNYGVPGGGGWYSATILGSNSMVICSDVTVLATNYQGIAVGTVTVGNVYTFSASGSCAYDSQGDRANPSGINPVTTSQVECSFANLNITNAVCPSAKCFSLVGKIQ